MTQAKNPHLGIFARTNSKLSIFLSTQMGERAKVVLLPATAGKLKFAAFGLTTSIL
jgi:hypothetical protein